MVTCQATRFRERRRIVCLSGLDESAAYFDSAYFRWQGASAERSARVVVPLLVERFHPRSVVDVGCGSGAWLQVFREHGVTDVLGVDAPYLDERALRIPAERFLAHDLAEPLHVDRGFDLALSLEAAHYVPEESAPTLVASIAALAPVVVFGAAVPHQGGGPGRNRQWPAWWGGLFAGHGLRAEDWLRPLVWEDARVDWWYAQNTIVYLRDGGAGEPIHPFVHPGLLHEVVRPSEPQSRRRLFRRG
jgi:SAM-dependent methyltransferase